MPPQETTEQPRPYMRDPDPITLLLEFREFRGEVTAQLNRCITDIKDLKDQTARRVDVLEAIKLDKDDFFRIKAEQDKRNEDEEKDLKWIMAEIQNFKGRYAIIAFITTIAISYLVSNAN